MVGPATEKKLKPLGIYTIGDLAQTELTVLRKRLGKHGETIWHFANGRNADVVVPEAVANKGYSNSTTTSQDIVSRSVGYSVLLSLCETVGMRMRRDGQSGSCITVHLRSSDFCNASHRVQLHNATNITSELFQVACKAFDEAWDGKTPLRQLGVQVTKLTEEAYQQYNLFSDISPIQYERKLRLDETVDALRDRFGENIICRATFTNNKEASMVGGLSKSRRTGVTKPIPKRF